MPQRPQTSPGGANAGSGNSSYSEQQPQSSGRGGTRRSNNANAPVAASSDSKMQKMKGMVSKVSFGAMVKKKNTLIVLSVITVFITVLVIAYIVYRVKRKNLKGKVLVKKPFELSNASFSKPMIITSDKIPTSKYGIEFTYSFWLYVHTFEATDLPKLIFLRGFENSYGEASPIVFMDAKSNRLNIGVRTNKSIATSSLSDIASPNSRFLVASIEYMPMQRWVHVACVIKENLLTVCLDGELYTVENVLDFSEGNVNPMISAQSGDMTIGNIPGSAGVRGHLTQMEIFNYALSLEDVYDVYKKGPFNLMQSLMSKLGLGDYKLRSPIYKNDSEEPE
jgi:Concanavalin A-like lectin/glucanases superfamily